MVDKKPNRHDPHGSLPIPTYDEAVNARPSSSQPFLGAEEISNDAERQGLLWREEQSGHQSSAVESPRSSLSFSNSSRASTEELRHEMMTQMDVLEPEANGGRIRGNLLRRNQLSKRITSLTHSLSSLSFRQWLPSCDYVIAKIPTFIRQFQPNWAIMISRLFALFLVFSLVYLLFFSDVFTVGRRGPGSATKFPDMVREFVRSNANASSIRESSKYLTLFDHVAGTKGSYVLGEFVENMFIESRLEDVQMERFDVYLNYPKLGGRRVAIIDPPELAWEALIEEEQAHESREQTMVFHGHSRSGKVKGPLVYANYGSREDFKRLHNQGIDMGGSIALVRYYGSQGDRALKVKAAELAGAVGCIIYSDPAEDGFLLGNDTVQRGAVSLMSWVVGDVLSSGFASFPGEERRDSKDGNPGLVNIPSIPLSWRDAQTLLQAVRGHGMKLDDHWKGAVPQVDEWWTGDANSPIVLLQNDQEEVERSPIYNILGKITGVEQPEKSIIVGSHRDAWSVRILEQLLPYPSLNLRPRGHARKPKAHCTTQTCLITDIFFSKK